MHVLPGAHQRIHENGNIFFVVFDPVEIAKQGLVTGFNVKHF